MAPRFRKAYRVANVKHPMSMFLESVPWAYPHTITHDNLNSCFMHLSIIQLQVISLPCSVYPGTCIRMIIPDRAQVVRSLNYDVLLSCEVHVHVAARDLTVSLVL